MKKIFFTTAALVALTLTTNAQTETTKKETKPVESTKPTGTAKPTANVDGTAQVESKTKTEEPKKSGTRMAINEKGLPGDKKAKKTETTNPK
jgi:hypothetical protein